MRLEADKIGYPILIKPTHGGGGKVCQFCFPFSSISLLLDFFSFLKNGLNCELNFFFFIIASVPCALFRIIEFTM